MQHIVGQKKGKDQYQLIVQLVDSQCILRLWLFLSVPGVSARGETPFSFFSSCSRHSRMQSLCVVKLSARIALRLDVRRTSVLIVLIFIIIIILP